MYLLLAAVLLCTPACSTTKAVKKDPDPLMGEDKEKKATESTMTHARSVPPVPEYQPHFSTASLAAATPLQGATRPIGIPIEPSKSPPANAAGWTGNGSTNTGVGVYPLVADPNRPVLGAPQPLGANANVAAGQVAAAPTSDQLQAELQKRGALWQKLDQIPTGVRFRCAVPHPQNPQAERMIETEAPDAATAIQAALFKIDHPSP